MLAVNMMKPLHLFGLLQKKIFIQEMSYVSVHIKCNLYFLCAGFKNKRR